MTAETARPKSRRALLAGGLGGLATVVASTLGRVDPVRAGSDGDVVLGATNKTSTSTRVDCDTPNVGLWGSCSLGYGVYGTSSEAYAAGVCGSSFGGAGVSGYSGSGEPPPPSVKSGVYGSSSGSEPGVYGAGYIGVHGYSATGIGVWGGSLSTSKPAVLGWSSSDLTGVQGYSGLAEANKPTAPAKTGVFGHAAQDAGAIGVKGTSTIGRGVQGEATSGFGVRASATTGNGLLASATTGTAGNFTTSGLKSGLALRTIGRVRFDNSVGIATIAGGKSSVTVTPGIDLAATAAVVATLQGGAGGTTSVRCITVNVTADTFTIYLTANAAVAVKVAWHVFG